jgi:hypothetical protein
MERIEPVFDASLIPKGLRTTSWRPSDRRQLWITARFALDVEGGDRSVKVNDFSGLRQALAGRQD